MYLAKENENNHLLRDMDKMRHNNKELNEQLVAGNTLRNELTIAYNKSKEVDPEWKKVLDLEH